MHPGRSELGPTPPASGDYGKIANPPPGPRWEDLLGRQDLVVALVSLYVIENSGIRLLASILRQQGIRVKEIYFKDWVNNRIRPPKEREVRLLMGELRRVGADLVGVSVRASAFHRLAASLSEQIRQELGATILWGGMHATSCPEDAAKVADLVCIGEAEHTVAELLRRLQAGRDIQDQPGLWVHTREGLARNPNAPLVADLDRLPEPDYHSPDKVFIEGCRISRGDPYIGEPIYLLMASRGCPFPSCTFCSNSVIDKLYPGQQYYRLRSLDHVLAEVAYAKKHFPNLKRIRFDDEEFPVNKDWFDAFCRRWPAEAGMPFEIHMDPRVVTPERLFKLKAAGLDTIFTGIQSTAKINRDLYCRNVSDARVLKAAQAIHASGVRAGYQVIIDDPVSTFEDKRKLFELLLQLPRPYEMILFSLTIYPGSAIAEELLLRGLIRPEDMEGPNTKVFRQFRVDLSYDRPDEDRFWTSLIVLVSKEFVPKALLRQLAGSRYLQQKPTPLEMLAFGANTVKIGLMGLEMLRRRELTWPMVRRWLSLDSLVTF